jgi:hypothetical protein
MAYTKAGPFVNGSAPGLNATFFNNMEAWLLTLSAVLNPSATNLIKITTVSSKKTGNSGTMTVYEAFAPGSQLQITRVSYDQYKNTSSTANTITLGSAFTQGCTFFSGLIEGTELLNGGSAITCSFVTTLGNAGADGSSNTGTKIGAYCFGSAGPFSSIREPGTNSVQRSGTLLLIGF